MFKVPDLEEITIEDILSLPESQYFERKSARIKASKLNIPLTAMANADGGIVAIGVSEGEIEGIKQQGETKINDYIQCGTTECYPNVKTKYRFISVTNQKGQEDKVLVIQIHPSPNIVHRLPNDEVYLRI